MELTFQRKLELYAQLAVVSGVNLQKDQLLVVNCPTVCAYFAKLLTKYGFEAGAKDVHIIWGNDDVSRLRFDNADITRYEQVPAWQATMLNDFANDGAAFLSVNSSNPSVFAGIDVKKPAAFRKAIERDCKDYRTKLETDACVWNILAIPNEEWAAKVFPEDTVEDAVAKLWEAIFTAVRINGGNPIQEWENHKQSFKEKIKWLDNIDRKSVV